MVMISVGVILGYAIQFFIPIQIMFPPIRKQFKLAGRHPHLSEMIFRVLMVLVTFSVAIAVPNLGLLISLIGAVCSTSLALVFPVIIECLVITRNGASMSCTLVIKNIFIIFLASVGFISGGYESIRQITQLYDQ